MSRDWTDHGEPDELARLFEIAENPPREWTPGELAELLVEELARPIGLADGTGDATMNPSASSLTIRQLLTTTEPSRAHLVELKDYAKRQLAHPRATIPAPVAEALYYAAVVVAQVRAETGISTLGMHQIARGSRRVLAHDWVDPIIREQLEHGLAVLEADLA